MKSVKVRGGTTSYLLGSRPVAPVNKKSEISGFRAGFSFRQALSRLALLTLLCCLAAALPGVQACRRFVLLHWDTYIGYRVIYNTKRCLSFRRF